MKRPYCFFLLYFCALAVYGYTISNDQLKHLAKEARKEAKVLSEKGWRVRDGAPSLDEQLKNSFIKECELDDDYKPLYHHVISVIEDSLFDEAKKKACQIAKVILLQKSFETQVKETIQSIDTATPAEAATFVQSSNNLQIVSEIFLNEYILAGMSDLCTDLVMYRQTPSGNYEVHVAVSISEAKMKVLSQQYKKCCPQGKRGSVLINKLVPFLY